MNKTVYIAFIIVLATIKTASAQRYLNDSFTQVDSILNIVYGAANDHTGQLQQLLLDFYEPHDDKLKKRPLFIYVHGGGFVEGTRKWPSIQLICKKLALKGYAVASIDYRLNRDFNFLQQPQPKSEMIDAMHDLKAAMRFFKANKKKYHIDVAKIVIGGESAGAVTTMMAAYIENDRDLAVYGIAEPDDIEGDSGNPGYSTKPFAEVCLCGMTLDTLAIRSPKSTPLLWIHGSKDPLLPFDWAQRIITRADHVGLSYEKHVFEGATHCPWYYGLPKWQSYLDSTVTYIAGYLYPKVTKIKPYPLKK